MVLNSAAADRVSLAPGETLVNPSAPPAVTHGLSENVILTTVDDLYNWCRLSSLFPLLYGASWEYPYAEARPITSGPCLTGISCPAPGPFST